MVMSGGYGQPFLPPPPPEAPKKSRRSWLIGAVFVIALAAGITVAYYVWLTTARDDYHVAVVNAEQINEDAAGVDAYIQAVRDDADVQMAKAEEVLAINATGLADSGLHDALADEVEALDQVLPSLSGAVTKVQIPQVEPTTPWELVAGAQAMRDQFRGVEHGAGEQRGVHELAEEHIEKVDDAAAALFLSISDYAAPILDANISAKNADKVAFADAAESASSQLILDSDAASAYADYVTAYATLVQSQNIEMAEKAGVLQDSRLAVEKFARDLAPGLMLDFDWADIVNGAGENGSMGGTANWWMDPGYATLTFSNSVASAWDGQFDGIAQALVAHEVGHALTIRCAYLYDTTTQESIEEWATAWAITQGYLGEGNGVSIYGEPRPEVVEAAKTCH